MEEQRKGRKVIDWETVEADWRAGVKSKQQMAVEYGVSRAAMDKRFTKLGVERDLRAKIQAKADALVARAEVAAQVAAQRTVTERVIVDDNADRVATIKISHRSDIGRFRKLVVALLQELEQETGNIELFEELGTLLRSDDERGNDRRADLYAKVISSAGRVDSLKKLSDTLKTLVALEREAYGMVEAEKPAQADPAELLREIASRLPD